MMALMFGFGFLSAMIFVAVIDALDDYDSECGVCEDD